MILQVNKLATHGGAARIAGALHRAYRAAGLDALFAVDDESNEAEGIVRIPNDEAKPLLSRVMLSAGAKLKQLDGVRGSWRLGCALSSSAEPGRTLDARAGREDFRFAGLRRLLRQLDREGRPPSIIHLHNLHHSYFDLRDLISISRRVPTVITLHDAWMLSGHCSHSFDCERWRYGCGNCPDLSIPPALCVDGSAANWQHKRAIYQQSRLWVVAPSRWLMDKVQDSILAPALIEGRIIANGVDQSIFCPGDVTTARRKLGLPVDARIVVFAANHLRDCRWKDYATLRGTLSMIAHRHSGPMRFLAIGDQAPPEQVGNAQITFVPYRQRIEDMALYYQAADVYLHPTKADTFPTTILEAMSCGRPVVATRVGGVPEQVRHGEHGYITEPGDAATMAEHVVRLFTNPMLHQALSAQALRRARRLYAHDLHVKQYLGLYNEMQETHSRAIAA